MLCCSSNRGQQALAAPRYGCYAASAGGAAADGAQQGLERQQQQMDLTAVARVPRPSGAACRSDMCSDILTVCNTKLAPAARWL